MNIQGVPINTELSYKKIIFEEMMYIKAISHCQIRDQSIVGEIRTIQYEYKFKQSMVVFAFDIILKTVYNMLNKRADS